MAYSNNNPLGLMGVSQLTPDHVQYFRKIIRNDSAVMDGVSSDATDDLEPINSDWMRKYRGIQSLSSSPVRLKK